MTTARQVIKAMRKAAETTEVLRTVGSHQRWQVNGHCKITVPLHTGDIPIGTLRSIKKQGEHCLGAEWL